MKKILLFSLAAALWACQPSDKRPFNPVLKSYPNDSLYTFVVAQHDSVMPKTSLMEAQQRQLQAQLETASAGRKDSLLSALSKLKKGQEEMMGWMNGFKNTEIDQEFFQPLSEAQIREYLKQEEVKIQSVAKLMLDGIAQAEQLLN